eukprot:TRINITY_DN14960_c0_g1_i1.p1 TRINITY_DN14960_c0_g1~~TRINITY_DN14960_c0_g1_i1.p1  ORF type:complete len:138 (+),score=11.61 TRINITY_DN14960_c0_g1_i1:238-651(+)
MVFDITLYLLLMPLTCSVISFAYILSRSLFTNLQSWRRIFSFISFCGMICLLGAIIYFPIKLPESLDCSTLNSTRSCEVIFGEVKTVLEDGSSIKTQWGSAGWLIAIGAIPFFIISIFHTLQETQTNQEDYASINHE